MRTSSPISALTAARPDERFDTFTIGFTEPSFDESAYAATVAAHLGSHHHQRLLEMDRARELIPSVLAALRDAGAERVHACFTHPVLSGRACELLIESEIERIVTTNTIPLRDDACRLRKINVLSIAPLLAKAIKSIHEETSVSSLFV